MVLLDLQLPDGFGLDCVNTVRAHHARVPVVVLTGIDDESLGLRCVAAGAQDYLSKQQLQRWHLRRALNECGACEPTDALAAAEGTR